MKFFSRLCFQWCDAHISSEPQRWPPSLASLIRTNQKMKKKCNTRCYRRSSTLNLDACHIFDSKAYTYIRWNPYSAIVSEPRYARGWRKKKAPINIVPQFSAFALPITMIFSCVSKISTLFSHFHIILSSMLHVLGACVLGAVCVILIVLQSIGIRRMNEKKTSKLHKNIDDDDVRFGNIFFLLLCFSFENIMAFRTADKGELKLKITKIMPVSFAFILFLFKYDVFCPIPKSTCAFDLFQSMNRCFVARTQKNTFFVFEQNNILRIWIVERNEKHISHWCVKRQGASLFEHYAAVR